MSDGERAARYDEAVSHPVIAIAGGGRVGQALGRQLSLSGETVVAVACRSADHARQAASFIGPGVESLPCDRLPEAADHILITVPDAAIQQVAETLALAGMRGVALHTCGALGPEALSPLAESGVACGVLHPLQTVPTPSADLREIAFAIDGDPRAVGWATAITETLAGLVLRVAPGARPLYHAAAVMASNYTVTLLDAALTLMREAGIPDELARRALWPLVDTSVANALHDGPEAALTGPIRRGDAATVAAHLEAIPDGPVRALYKALGLRTLELAGHSEDAVRELLRLLRDNKEQHA